ncbi:MAG TPA: GNAT family N-acetyltransferase [Acidimicrobiia bacterium]|nr:GNAT family N-acetyltransferase [Acidimicrobiia bacterium]
MTAEPIPATLALRRLAAGDDLAGVAALMAAYLAEVRRKLLDGYGVALEEATPDGDLLVEIGPLLEPPEALYLAEIDGLPAGTGGLKAVAPGVAEIKRMYTDPAFRGRGVARAVLTRLIADARAAGYRRLRLETAAWMVEAHALYRSLGFADTPPHPDPEFGCLPGYEHLTRYMALSLEER